MQFLFLRAVKPHVVFLLTSMLLFTTGCEDDEHEHDHDEEHTDADGFVLEDKNGVIVYREFEGTVTGEITVAVGEVLELAVHFLDDEGNEIEHDEEEGEEHEDDGDGLVVSGNDASVAIVEVEDHEEGEEGEEHHENALHIEGVSTGSTKFLLQLMHEGHADYTSTDSVSVTVN